MLKIKIQKIGDAKIPNYAHQGDAGLDLYSVEENYVLKSGEHKGFATGIKMEIPQGYAGLIWDKSGLALKHCIKIMGGVIDSTYRGEIAVILINLGKKDYKVEKDAKIAQMLFQKIEKAEIEEVENLSDTQRGEGGFGSSGLK
ncbi:MAG: dUTP diphosphatase [Candidatus Andersenbacteria bacterium]|nr:dUTP diphosphatase [Candidatus Andersenbacteria bacterium]